VAIVGITSNVLFRRFNRRGAAGRVEVEGERADRSTRSILLRVGYGDQVVLEPDRINLDVLAIEDPTGTKHGNGRSRERVLIDQVVVVLAARVKDQRVAGWLVRLLAACRCFFEREHY